MSKKNKRKANLKSSLLILLLIAILLIASTYAWFTANKQVEISTLDVNVAAQGGIQISADGQNWKTILSVDDINPQNLATTYGSNTNQIPTILEPVSTGGTVTTGKLDMFYGKVTANEASGKWELTATKETDTQGTGADAGHYIAFDIFLRLDAQAETPVSLTQASGVTNKQGSTDKGLQNSTRVAFLLEGTEPVGTDIGTIQGLQGATNVEGDDSDTTVIWEPNSDAHKAAAQANAKNTYGVDITVGENGATKVTHYGIIDEITSGIELINTHTGASSTYFNPVPTTQTSATMTDTEIFTLQPGITKVRVYMWVEGQDFDCDNSASGSDLSFDVQFSIP